MCDFNKILTLNKEIKEKLEIFSKCDMVFADFGNLEIFCH